MGRILIAGASRAEYLDEKKLKQRRKEKMNSKFNQADLAALDLAIAKLEGAAVDKDFKRAALKLYREMRAIAVRIIPLFEAGEVLENRIRAVEKRWPQYKDWL